MYRLSACLLIVFCACSRSRDPVAAPGTSPSANSPETTPPGTPHSSKISVGPPDVRPNVGAAKVAPMEVCDPGKLDPLSAARKYYDEERYEPALSCASQAAALRPDDPLGHSERGAALTALGRLDEAQVAYARALALDPDELDALLGAAHLYTVTLASSREHDELGSVYAEHGLSLAEDERDKKLIAEFALLSAMAFNDLGESKQALDRAERSQSIEPENKEASYERAVALFELCRFPEAKAAFTTMLDDPERAAHAHEHLGLILEREGKFAPAEKHFSKARELSPDDFPEPVALGADEFKAEVKKAVAGLPTDMQRDLKGIPVTAEELPKDEDLLSGDPPLSPAILGLFRGPSLNESCEAEDGDPCRSVALYRRNLARATKSRDELVEQIRVTLLHEVGHLRGEDDFELAARGLE